jgi:sorting nexin-29
MEGGVENMDGRKDTRTMRGLICPTYKQGDRLACENYCGISLCKTAYKVFSNTMFQRLGPYVEKIVGNYKCGFRDGQSTSDQIPTI